MSQYGKIHYGIGAVNLNRVPKKTDRQKITARINHIFKHVKNMMAETVIIDDVEYLIDVENNFIGKIN